MRIAVIHNLASGGAWRRLASTLHEMDGQVQEFTLTGARHVTDNAQVISYHPQAENRSRLRRPLLRYQDLRLLEQSWRELAVAVNEWQPDVVFANPCRFVQAPLGLLDTQAPSLYYCDEPRRASYDQEARATTKRLTRGLYAPLRKRLRALDYRALAAANSIVTNSDFTVTRIRQSYDAAAQVIPLGVDSCFAPVSSVTSAPGETAGGGDQRRHVLSVGTLIPSKGHDLVIQAVGASGVGLPMVIVAPRPMAQEQARLMAIAREAGVALQFALGITDLQLRDLYRGALATLYLARGEPLGLASLESQACGTPVIAADEGGLRETVTDGVTGYLVPRTASAAAAALSSLTEPQVRARMSAAAVAAMAGRDWRATAAGTALHLTKLVQQRISV